MINAEALAYMRDRALSGPVIERLATHPEHTFPDEAAMRCDFAAVQQKPGTASPSEVQWGKRVDRTTKIGNNRKKTAAGNQPPGSQQVFQFQRGGVTAASESSR